MFKQTIQSSPLQRYTALVPRAGADLFSHENIASLDGPVRDFFKQARTTSYVHGIREAAFRDFIDLREQGLLGGTLEWQDQKGASIGVYYLDAWNDFLTGEENLENFEMITNPVLEMIEAEIYRLFIPGKYRVGAITPAHEQQPIHWDVIEKRLTDVNATLTYCLSHGSSSDHHPGSSLEHAGTGLLRAKLKDGRPHLERARNIRDAKTRSWKPIALSETPLTRHVEHEAFAP